MTSDERFIDVCVFAGTHARAESATSEHDSDGHPQSMTLHPTFSSPPDQSVSSLPLAWPWRLTSGCMGKGLALPSTTHTHASALDSQSHVSFALTGAHMQALIRVGFEPQGTSAVDIGASISSSGFQCNTCAATRKMEGCLFENTALLAWVLVSSDTPKRRALAKTHKPLSDTSESALFLSIAPCRMGDNYLKKPQKTPPRCVATL